MTDDEFQKFVDACYAELESKQAQLADQYGLGRGEWQVELDVEAEQIRFTHDGEVRVSADVIPIGSFHESSQSWMWGWANDGMGEPLQYKASRLMNLTELTGRKDFITEVISADAGSIWELAAIGLHHLGCEACYRVPSGQTLYFYALTNLQKHS